jgi:hypothetical protein
LLKSLRSLNTPSTVELRPRWWSIIFGGHSSLVVVRRTLLPVL